ncbi:brain-specific angiogenesis inhibitor 1-associated protein 2-like protein 2 isoform X2 [Oncorhynchus masou masou]|uniref:brain-specific angiogenesis inhibitor 1-associated protein 2-like protein 2 isoform X2 n=1 Tax=Oncorhynchus masou masou TaxID=90313 RepID=UPI003183D341
MSGQNIDQLHRSTLGIYASLMDQFNPSLQKLVSLGNSYMQAFQALAVTSEAYFSTLAKIGEQAFHTMSSCLIGDVLIQISENQKRLTTELEAIFRWFHSEVLQEMDNNVKLDKDYIAGSRRRYEMEVRTQATSLERQLRGGAYKDEYIHFLRDSQREALMEEERRYRFLAEKHCGLTQSVVYLMNKTGAGGGLQQIADGWRDQVNATRGPGSQNPSRLDQDNTFRMREEERGSQWSGKEEQPLGRVPSRVRAGSQLPLWGHWRRPLDQLAPVAPPLGTPTVWTTCWTNQEAAATADPRPRLHPIDRQRCVQSHPSWREGQNLTLTTREESAMVHLGQTSSQRALTLSPLSS